MSSNTKGMRVHNIKPTDGADTIVAGVGTLMQDDDVIKKAVQHVSEMNDGVLCGETEGLPLGVGVEGVSISAGLNLPTGVNETCMTHTRATTTIYGVDQLAGTDTVAVGIGAVMQEGEPAEVEPIGIGAMAKADILRDQGRIEPVALQIMPMEQAEIKQALEHVASMASQDSKDLTAFRVNHYQNTLPVTSGSFASNAFNAIKDKAPSMVVSAVVKCSNLLKRNR